jgi:hypothetical protein
MTDNQKKVVAGVILVGLAVGVWIWSHNDKATCALTTAGVVSISAGLTHGESVSKIVADAAAPVACEAFVQSLKSDPADQVTFDLQTQSGTITQTVQGTSLTATATSPPQTGASRVVACFISWRKVTFLYDACIRGTIEP